MPQSLLHFILGHTCTCAGHVFQSTKARTQTTLSALWDPTALTTTPPAGPASANFKFHSRTQFEKRKRIFSPKPTEIRTLLPKLTLCL